MKTLDKIPTGKLERTSSLLKAGAKVGVNYLKYYGNKITKDEVLRFSPSLADKLALNTSIHTIDDIVENLKNL